MVPAAGRAAPGPGPGTLEIRWRLPNFPCKDTLFPLEDGMEDPISSERTAHYRSYDIRSRVVGLIPPYLCAFIVMHSAAPHGERITRTCDGHFLSIEDAHQAATTYAAKLIDSILADAEARSGLTGLRNPDPP
jgi:hypothetical protein